MHAQRTALHLVHSTAAEQPKSAADRLFDHWVFMLGKNPLRTKMGPTRRKVIERALALYEDEDTLMLAIEGCAASRWHAGENDRGRPFDDIELILRDESHVERFAADGEALRARADRAVQRQAAEAAQVQQIDGADGVAARERMLIVRREIAARSRGAVR
jgi:hypothetical protein